MSAAAFLTRAEERALFDEYRRTGDKKIEARIFESQLALVGRMTALYKLKGIDRADLFQEGALGLVHAIRRFDPSRGVRLSTYAAHWIRAFEFRYLLANYRLVRIGTTQAQRRIFFHLSSLRARLSAAGIEPTPARLAPMLGVDERSVRETEARIDARDQSLDAPAPGDTAARSSRLPSGGAGADERLEAEELAEILAFERDRYRHTLDERRRVLFDQRWVVDQPQPTLKEMGDRLGVSRERARQIESRMLMELGERVKEHLAA